MYRFIPKVEREGSEPLKIMCIGDPHYHMDRVEENKLFTAEMLRIAKLTKPDLIVNLGDTVDKHRRDGASPKQAIDALIELSKVAPLIVLIGNHDISNPNLVHSQEHFAYGLTFSRYPILIVDYPMTVFFKKQKLLFIPYCPIGCFKASIYHGTRYIINFLENKFNIVSGERAITDVSKRDFLLDYKNRCSTETEESVVLPDMVFCHQEIKGSMLEDQGDEWTYPSVLVCGHIHEHKLLRRCTGLTLPNIHYVGTPRQANFGESKDRTVSIYTLPSDKVHIRSIEGIKFDRIPVDIPKRHTMTTTYDGIDELIPKVKELGSEINPLPYSTQVRIVVHVNALQRRMVLVHPTILMWKDIGIKLKYVIDKSEMMDVIKDEFMATITPTIGLGKWQDMLEKEIAKLENREDIMTLWKSYT